MAEFSFNKTDFALVCLLHGRLGTDNLEPFAQALLNKMSEYQPSMDNPRELKVSFDLKNVSYIASSFIRICITTSKQLEEGNFKIINASPLIKKTFVIAGLDKLLNVT